MKPGERVRIIEECTKLLAGKSRASRELTFEEFGFSTSGFWDATPDDELITRALADGPEDRLSELLTFLRGEDAEPTHRDSDEPWGDLPVRVFLSHIHGQRHLVGEVKRTLDLFYSVDAFVAHDDIHVSAKWRDVIKAALATCDLFVAFLHDGYHDSQWCDQEAGWALGRGIPVISARPTGGSRGKDGFLEEHQDLMFAQANSGAAWDIAKQIFIVAVTDERTRARGQRSLVEAFVNSPSFDTTRWLWSLIDRVPKFDAEQLRRLEYAVETNNQVYDAYLKGGEPVPAVVERLVKRHEPEPEPEGPIPF